MLVRPATIDDAQPIWTFVCALENTIVDYTIFQQLYAHLLSKDDTIYLVAIDKSGTILGYISCHGQYLLHHAAKVFEIQELFVAPSERNKKLGHLLINKVEQQLQQQGYRYLEVTSNSNRTNAHRFYEQCGFTKTHVKFTKVLNGEAPATKP
jgi:PhnO protein